MEVLKERAVENLEDDELQVLVDKLRADVQQKAAQLSALNSDASKLHAIIHNQQEDRQKFTQKVFQVEEIAPLMERSKQLKEALENKEKHLHYLQEGTSREQSELEDLKRRLEATEMKGKCKDQHKETTLSIMALERAYEENVKLSQDTKQKLEQAQRELASLKERKRHKVKSMDEQVEMLIQNCCKKAGLQLRH